MYARRGFLIASLILTVLGASAAAQDAALRPEVVRKGALGPDGTQAFLLPLATGDFARIAVDPLGQPLIVKTYDPAGKPFRGAEIGPAAGRLELVAEDSGSYRVEIAGKEPTAGGRFTVTLEKVVTLAERLAPLAPVAESRRIQALRASIERGERQRVSAFWEDIARTGAPLIEPIEGDGQHMAVTFIWKGTPTTRNVLVLWLPYLGVAPDEFLMARLGETDVWYKTIRVHRRMRLAYTLAPNVGRLRPMSLGIDGEAITMVAAAARPDPLNPKRYRVDPESVDAAEFRGQSILEMPDALPQPWIARLAGVPEGRVVQHRFASAMLGNERQVSVYLPPRYAPGAEPYPLLVLFDEDAYLSLVPTPTILDNLIAEGLIPPVVALLIGNAPGARDRELVCNPAFSRALANELLSWARGMYDFTSDPRRTVVAGSSAGGLAAACTGLWHPEVFGNVLAQSGAFHRAPFAATGTGDANAEPNWMARQFIASPKKPVRFYLDAGSAEFNATGSADAILLCTRTLRDVLRAKGYEVHFQEFEGGHDYLSWRGTLADGLIALLGEAAGK